MGRYSPQEKTMENAIASYMENIIAIGRSPHTIEQSARVLNNFYEFYVATNIDGSVKDKWNFHDPTFTTIQAYRDHLRDTGLANSSISQYLKKLNAFFEYASDPSIAFFETNPVSKRLKPDMSKADKRPYDLPLTNEQIAMLWSADKPYGAVHWEKTYAIVILLLTSKIRNSELLALTPKDLDWEMGEVIVEHGKGNKYRAAPFTEIAQQAVKMYFASGLRPADATDDDPLFGTTRDNERGSHSYTNGYHKGSRQWLSKLVEHHVFLVTGVHGVRSHDLRHLGAYIDLNTGKPIEELQAELGHSSPTTTQIYSGRLTGRRNRGSIKLAMEEQQYQIERNNAILQAKAV